MTNYGINRILINRLKSQSTRGVQFKQAIADKPWALREFEVENPEGHRILFGQLINC